ncbi:MAG: hypothetical protein [Caudoviricetes sp.]|nr:MAG: hypothetical protein [Caudoviricetes sp.]
MKQCKHPMVKKLRKAGYNSREAMALTKLAISYRNRFDSWYMTRLDCWFTWSNTREGHDYWSNINCITE